MSFVDFRFYEVVLLFKQQSSVDVLENFFSSLFSSLLDDKDKITLLYSEFWGKRKLAYKIKKNQHSYMYFLRIKATPLVLSEFKKSLKISEDIIRYFITKIDNDPEYITSQSHIIKSLASDISLSLTAVNDKYSSVILSK